jgi:taurine dioxygenase
MSTWIERDGLKWRTLEPFGAEIGQDLSALSPSAAERFVRLFNDYGLILARDQSLTMPQQIALLNLIGPMLPGTDGNSYISTDATYGVAKAELGFHSDYAFTNHPVEALSLHAVDVVDGASSTRFAGAERALSHLPRSLVDSLRDRSVEMVFAGVDAVVIRACDTPDLPRVISTQRPCIGRNARTGRECLVISEMHAAALPGLTDDAARETLRNVFAQLYSANNVFEHVWRRGDIVIWDNLTYQHARGSLESVGRRVLQRVAVGEKSLSQMYPDLFRTMASA